MWDQPFTPAGRGGFVDKFFAANHRSGGEIADAVQQDFRYTQVGEDGVQAFLFGSVDFRAGVAAFAFLGRGRECYDRFWRFRAIFRLQIPHRDGSSIMPFRIRDRSSVFRPNGTSHISPR